MPSHSSVIERHRRNQAVTACCLAAAALGDERLSGGVQGKTLMSCLGVLGSTYPIGKAPTMEQFRAGLKRPLAELLSESGGLGAIGHIVLLDEHGLFTDEAGDLCTEHLVPSVALEHHWQWSRVAAEQEERRIYEVMRRLPGADYTRAREWLVTHPTGDVQELRTMWDKLWGRFELYEPVKEWQWCQIRGWWFACPMCRWPMRVVHLENVISVRCEAHVRHGVAYTCRADEKGDRAPVLQPAGPGAVDVKGRLAISESRAVSRVIWRYVTLPGLLECDLRDYAEGKGAEVLMWPHKDRYDLSITLSGKVWRVDAKAWASPIALGEALLDTPPAEPDLIIVIPDHQRASREMLTRMLRGTGYKVMTAAGLKKDIAATAGRGRRK